MANVRGKSSLTRNHHTASAIALPCENQRAAWPQTTACGNFSTALKTFKCLSSRLQWRSGPTYNDNNKASGQTQIVEAENQSNFGLMGPMSVISKHAVLHTRVTVTKRAHIVLTPRGGVVQLDTEGPVGPAGGSYHFGAVFQQTEKPHWELTMFYGIFNWRC